METGLLLLALAATLYVMHWLVTNDGVPCIGDQTGLIRMKPPPDEGEGAMAAGRRRPPRRDGRDRRDTAAPR